jgi:hypothetical protein
MSDVSTPIRMFTEAGVVRFREYLQQVKGNATTAAPAALLYDPVLSQVIDPDVQIKFAYFGTTLEMVEYLHPAVLELPLRDKFYNTGLYAWLSAFYFDVVCPLEKGSRKPGEEARHIPQRRTYMAHRHLIAAPLRMYASHGLNHSIILLYSRPNTMNGFLRRVLENPEIAMNSGMLEAIHLLYWDEKKQQPKPSSSHDKPGALQRFISVMNQFNLTYDLQGMNGQQIVKLLPKREFGRWLGKA